MTYENSQANRQAILPPSESLILDAVKRFERKYPTEEDCLESMYNREGGSQFVYCRICGGDKIERDYGSRTGKCISCNKKVWLTSRTFFSRIRAARPWMLAIWLFQEGIAINSSHLIRFANVASSTAQTIIKKICFALGPQNNEIFCQIREIPSSNFVAIFGKRSRVTPAGQHPRSEQEEYEIRSPGLFHLDPQDDPDIVDSLSVNEKTVLALLSSEPSCIDSLCQRASLSPKIVVAALSILTIEGLVEEVSGGRYVLRVSRAFKKKTWRDISACETEQIDDEYSIVDQIAEFACAIFHRISRKYLQMYANLYCCVFEKSEKNACSLLEKCKSCRYISYEEIRAYVTPQSILISNHRA